MLCVVTRMDLTIAYVKLDILEMAVLAVVRFSFVDITRPQTGGRREGAYSRGGRLF